MLGPWPPASSTPHWGQKQSVILSFVFVPPSAPKCLSKILGFTQHQHQFCRKSETAKQGAICSHVLVLSEKSNGKSRMTKTQILLKITWGLLLKWDAWKQCPAAGDYSLSGEQEPGREATLDAQSQLRQGFFIPIGPRFLELLSLDFRAVFFLTLWTTQSPLYIICQFLIIKY